MRKVTSLLSFLTKFFEVGTKYREAKMSPIEKKAMAEGEGNSVIKVA